MTPGAALLWFGAVLLPLSGLATGWLAGRFVRGPLCPILTRLPPRAYLPLGVGVGLAFMVGFPAVAQLPLQWLWTGSIPSEDARSTCAAMVTTTAGELAAITWAATLGLPLGFRSVPPRHYAEAGLLAVAAVTLSASWTLAVERLGFGPTSQRAGELVGLVGDPGARTLAIVFILVTAPILEETLFRGILYDLVDRRRGRQAAILWTGLLFGLLHAADPVAVPVLVCFGWGLGWLRAHSGGTRATWWAHVLNNTVGVVALLS